ncbi:archaetidylserine decarboxylase [Zoogloea sp.]|uniref:archaetidylserine decarboxylase n=1 Tax=Zoogloea sp. TaxID=49181 RepID=UPI00263126D3|nr:archaetidylserine decarboxylase [Zoogloea sp.]MDD3354872.1 archaetidylserine decarboxylase [Zoogloea sp.]
MTDLTDCHYSAMTDPSYPTPSSTRHGLHRLIEQEDLNFLLTNRLPRALLTRFMGWFSKIEHPLLVKLSIRVWRLFADLDLSEARKTEFRSIHDCFTRELKAGTRPIDPDPRVLTSPCDAIVGACGQVEGTTVLQAKDAPYPLIDLLGKPELVEQYRDGSYVTLRLKSSMYHRFHAPADLEVEHVTYISGDVWNVNPPALKRIAGLYCKNERAVIRTRLRKEGAVLTLVPVAAILVASIRLHWLNVLLHLRYRGPHEMPGRASFDKGQEMGWFEHGSTIIVFAPGGYRLAEGLGNGSPIRMGEALLVSPAL